MPLAYRHAGAALQHLGIGEPQVSAVSHGHGVCGAGVREDTGEAEAEQSLGRQGLLGGSRQSNGRTRAES